MQLQNVRCRRRERLTGSCTVMQVRLLPMDAFHHFLLVFARTCWFPVSAVPAVHPDDDVYADARESGQSEARWRCWRGQPPSQTRRRVSLKRERTPPLLHPLRLLSLRPRTQTTGRSGSGALQSQVRCVSKITVNNK